MASVREHYDGHLGPIYGWTLGNFDALKVAARTGLRAAGVSEGAGRIAVDLGAGTGAHAIALSEAGYLVTAIDTCAALLKELQGNPPALRYHERRTTGEARRTAGTHRTLLRDL